MGDLILMLMSSEVCGHKDGPLRYRRDYHRIEGRGNQDGPLAVPQGSSLSVHHKHYVCDAQYCLM